MYVAIERDICARNGATLPVNDSALKAMVACGVQLNFVQHHPQITVGARCTQAELALAGVAAIRSQRSARTRLVGY